MFGESHFDKGIGLRKTDDAFRNGKDGGQIREKTVSCDIIYPCVLTRRKLNMRMETECRNALFFKRLLFLV